MVSQAVPQAVAHGRGGRVLVVDDDPGIRLLHAVALADTGVTVDVAADGRDGLRRARAERPDVVVTDLTMPGLDGFDLIEELQRDPRTAGIPFVVVSGEPDLASRRRAYALGASAFVTKPFDPLHIAALVVALLHPLGVSGPEVAA